MVLLRIHVLLGVVFLHQSLQTSSTPEEAFLGYPLQLEDEPYIYLDSRAEPAYSPSAIKQSETRRRSTLDKNFARFGRSGYDSMKTKLLSISDDPDTTDPRYANNIYDADMDLIGMQIPRASFSRNGRSGEKNDQFIRFGRGKSDFIRFGRLDPATRDFIRFGRSTRSVKNERNAKKTEARKIKQERKKRSLRSNGAVGGLQYFSKKSDGSNFVRFGRGDRNDNFMRFGRMLNGNYAPSHNIAHGNGENVAMKMNATNVKKYLQELQHDSHPSHDLLLQMLSGWLTRSQIWNLQQMHDTLSASQSNAKNTPNKCS